MADPPLPDDQIQEFLEMQFPAWRSFELFGPPGVGKSNFARRASRRLAVLTMCDRQAVRYFADRDIPRITGLANRMLTGRMLKNFYGMWLRITYRRFWNNVAGPSQQYIAAVERVLEAFPLASTRETQRFVNRVRGSGAFTARAMAEHCRMIVDEGILNQLGALIARSTGPAIDRNHREVVRDCLVKYPWEKNGLLLEASVKSCEARQIARGHVLFSRDRPQSIFHETAAVLAQLCEDAGWKVRRLDNEGAVSG